MILGDKKLFEKFNIGSNLKKVSKHTHIQCFSKTTWSRKQRNFISSVKNLFNQLSFVYIIILISSDFRKIFNAYWKS